MNSELYRGEIAERFLAETGKRVLSREQANIAVELMEHRARTRGEVREAAVRVAGHEGVVYVDLSRSDGKVVRIDRTGYTVIDQSPVAFVRGRGGELPLPAEGGTYADFERHLNLSPKDRLQTVGFAIAMFNPAGPYPILLGEGPHGTAKTSLLDKLMALGDPPGDPLDTHMAQPRSERDLQIEAAGVRVVGLDNMSAITGEQADWWCRLATGGSTSVRKNYSDDAQIRHRAIRPTIITCIGTPSGKGDFLSRCVRVTTLPIPNPLPDEMVRAAFEADRPRMLGFLFRCVSAALRNKPALEAAVAAGDLRLPRMAGFAMFVEGAAELLGLVPGKFSTILRDGQSTMQAEAALGNPLGMAIMRYFSDDGSRGGLAGAVFGGDDKRNTLEGAATEMLLALRGYDNEGRDWPATNMLKDRLRRIGPGLADLGVEWKFVGRTGHINKSSYVLTRTAAFVPIGEARRG
ncbi:hypothetical protein [Sphingomonas profundi]|uniref:hypothetical protein n=1 Tax=Alterirhizorhabdus profundi TaxID=2681549 RepID=UPI0012E899D6|nr:hypothetical protein [Sphingomonas profundi]